MVNCFVLCRGWRTFFYKFVFYVFREKLIRLQHENKILKLNQEGSDNEKIALLQSLLDDANLRKNELETENRSEVLSSFSIDFSNNDLCF